MTIRRRSILAVLLALAAAAALVWFFAGNRGGQKPALPDEGSVAVITVGGREMARIPLTEPQTITVEQDSGAVNVIEITERGAVMRSSTCRNQLCVHMGEVTVDNWEYRPNGAFIICLPNQVSVELVVKE